MIDYKAEAEKLREKLIEWRRDFHKYPEVGFEVQRTAGIVADELRRLGLTVQTEVGKTGVVAILEGASAGETVLWRSDMDGLPIQEENEVDYASVNPNQMHACGHDGHMAIALGAAHVLAAHRDKIKGRVKFMFQPAEEMGAGGALAMIRDGVLEAPEPDVSFGLHLWNTLPLGKVGLAPGAIMAGSSFFTLRVRGTAGHAAMPHTTIDPVACSGQLISALHTIVGRKMDAMAGAVVLSVTSVQTSSHAYNAIPAYVTIGGTFRSFSAFTSEMLEQHIRSVSKSVCESVGCELDIHIRHPNIPVINDERITRRMRSAFAGLVGEQNFVEERTMASEDMAYVLEDVPGVYFFLGSANKDKELTYPHHHPRFNFDEDVLPLGVALACRAISEYVM
ncbi:MAG: Metal-dependent amidase/aminoacylase/carboxypeptidase [Chloroflexi bacterium AL-W]|nr:Metal-dependent amidase/aminoacylase/carboxypeptidase [Chloroflexi bacterium AL-W]